MLKIIIADDHKLFREGLQRAIERIDFDFKIEKITHAENGKMVLDLLSTETYAIVFLDINMPVMNGKTTAIEITAKHQQTKIICMSTHDDKYNIEAMFEVGVHAYLFKNSGDEFLKEAVETVLKGKIFVPAEVTESLLKKSIPVKSISNILNEREIEILRLLCQGLTGSEIADKCNISKKAIEWHKKHILEKTNCKNAVALAVYAEKHGYLTDNYKI